MSETQELSKITEKQEETGPAKNLETATTPYDVWTTIESFVRAILGKWRHVALCAGSLTTLAAIYAFSTALPSYSSTVQLIKNDLGSEDASKTRQLNNQNIVNLLRSPELVQKVANQSRPKLSARAVAARTSISAERNSEFITLMASGRTPEEAVSLANLYAREAVRYGPSQWADKLQAAKVELTKLLEKYTEYHPLVIQQQAKIDSIEQQLKNPKAVTATAKDEDQPGYYRVLSEANLDGVVETSMWPRILLFAILGCFLGTAVGILFISLQELFDTKIKSVADVKRVTRLPILASLADLKRMSSSARSNWAFRTWTSLQSKLGFSPNHGIVCGITSSGDGEGLSTWVSLLANAASQRGLRVLTIGTRGPCLSQKMYTPKTELETQGNESNFTTLNHNVLNSPAQVTQKLVGPDPQPLIHVPLTGWVWNLERRKQWQNALNHWKKIENLVILVELPPASTPEAVLLAENIPNLIWLSDTGKADAHESADQLKTLREANCNLVGAFVNHTPAPLVKNRFARWFAPASLIFLLVSSAHPCFAQEKPVDEKASQVIEQPVNPTVESIQPAVIPSRAEWQKRLTLGPGDVLSISLFGQSDITRAEVPVGPDGRISFLEAQDIQASGLTIDELRQKLDAELGRFRRAPRTIVSPISYRSKKYYVLGHVMQKGSFTMERPVTVIEAISRARGLETGILDGNTVDVVDLSHSFLARNGKRVPIDFEKLFLQGDLSQNVSLEPNDYLYFPPNNLNEVYVLGEVKNPGVVLAQSELNVIGAVAGRGGFTEKAWTKKVLVVRGSLTHPETFILDTTSILSARDLNFKLRPKDIIYVSARPWAKVEDLIDIAATAFIEGAVITATGANIGPILRHGTN